MRINHLVSVFTIAIASFATASVYGSIEDFNSLAINTDIRSVAFADFSFSADTFLRVGSFSPGNGFDGSQTVLQDDPRTGVIRSDFSILGVSFVSLIMGDFNVDSETIFLNAFDSGNNLIDSDSLFLPSSFTGGELISVMGSNIAYVEFGSTGTFPNSVYFDDFTYFADDRVIPEPTTFVVWSLLGAMGLCGVRRKNRS